MALQIYLLVCVTILGAVIGSFLNVCIYRLPWEKSIFWPSSRCPKCLNPIRARDNIPIVSWFILRGRCRDCGEPFSARYMLIEALTAALFGAVFWIERPAAAGDACRFGFHTLLLAALIVATFIDLDLQIIPDSVTVPGMIVGVLAGTALAGLAGVLLRGMYFQPVTQPASDPAGPPAGKALVSALLVLVGWSLWALGFVSQVRRTHGPVGLAEVVLLVAAFFYLAGQSAVLAGLPATRPWPGWSAWFADHPHWQGLATGIIGLLVGAGLVWFIRVVGTAVLRKEAMGFGDVTLMAMVGAFLGWQPTVMVFFIAPFFGLVVGVVQWLTRGEHMLPYGPYLSLASVVVVLFWPQIWPVVQGHFAVLELVPPWLAVLLFLPILLFSLARTWGQSLPADFSEKVS